MQQEPIFADHLLEALKWCKFEISHFSQKDY